MAKKKGGKAPKAPDPVKTAEAQTVMNKELAGFNAELNRTNSTNAYGGSRWVKDADGRWSEEEYYNPEIKDAIDKQITAANTQADALTGAGERARDSLSNEFQYDGIAAPTAIPTLDTSGAQGVEQTAPTYDSEYRDSVIKQVGDYLKGNVTEQYDRDSEALRNRLALQGFSLGSEVSSREQGDQAKTRDRAVNDAMVKAIMTGQDVANSDYSNRITGFQNTNTARTQALSNLLTEHRQRVSDTGTQQDLFNNQYAVANNERTRYLNELTALMSGSQVQPFSTGTRVGGVASQANGTDMTGLVNQQYQSQMDKYNAGQARSAGNTQAAIGLAGAAAMAFF